MKVVFAGPSLHGSVKTIPSDIVLLPPAAQGDVHRQARSGANVIGLVDGVFEDCASVWHKEILHALSLGVRIYGAASMGALRAAECADFGMIGIGQIFASYRDGDLVDDADVALSHAPKELGYAPLSVPLVNVRATAGALAEKALLTHEEAAALVEGASAVFFKDRTWAVVAASAGLHVVRAQEVRGLLSHHNRSPKREDAEALVEAVALAEDRRGEPSAWTLQRTSLFDRFLID
jgi:hypothetical protein